MSQGDPRQLEFNFEFRCADGVLRPERQVYAGQPPTPDREILVAAWWEAVAVAKAGIMQRHQAQSRNPQAMMSQPQV